MAGGEGSGRGGVRLWEWKAVGVEVVAAAGFTFAVI